MAYYICRCYCNPTPWENVGNLMSPRSHEHDGQCNAIHTVDDMTTVHSCVMSRRWLKLLWTISISYYICICYCNLTPWEDAGNLMSPRSHEHDGQCNAIHTVADMTTVHFGERGWRVRLQVAVHYITGPLCLHMLLWLAYYVPYIIVTSSLEKKMWEILQHNYEHGNQPDAVAVEAEMTTLHFCAVSRDGSSCCGICQWTIMPAYTTVTVPV